MLSKNVLELSKSRLEESDGKVATAASELIRRLRTHGTEDLTRRVARRAARKLSDMFDTSALDFPLLPQDVADSTKLRLAAACRDNIPGGPLSLAWLCTPPSPGSGGHTTLFRMVKGLEDRGHICTLLLYNRHGSDISRAEMTVRRHWPWLRAHVAPVPDTISGFDACVASSWETAHVLASRGAEAPMHRFYFIQDYEPFFYPRGSLYSLAEDSYRFGFKNIALGKMVAETVLQSAGKPTSMVPFGCDGKTYELKNLDRRHGVVFYARETADRRGTLLGKLALEEFHRRHPEQTIYVYGDPLTSWQVPHRHCGRLTALQLSQLYNETLAGLALSFTNISLVAEEMLSCGTIPVVNDHAFARWDMSAPAVRWAPPTPGGIAQALCEAVESGWTAAETTRAASQARKDWLPAQTSTAFMIENEVQTR